VPPKAVNQIVNSRIIDKDEKSCDHILSRIYKDQAVIENKIEAQ